jgi:charged multivesicular body protein 2A
MAANEYRFKTCLTLLTRSLTISIFLSLSSPLPQFALPLLLLKAMVKMNKIVSIPAITKMMQEFAKENEKSDMMQEMMGDAMDDVMEDDGNAEEEDQIVGQVLDEIGINFDQDIPNAPIQQNLPVVEVAAAVEERKVAAMVGGGGESASGASLPKAPGGSDDKGKGGGDDAPGGGDAGMSDLEARLNNLRN